jgi:tRNA pseudouridine38-40 synthase
VEGRETTFRLEVGYDGTAFRGWQRQPGMRTVQGELEIALAGILAAPVRLTAAGRTDAGVHARGQVVSFRAATRLPATALVPLLRRALPSDICPLRAVVSDDAFDARRSAVRRRYCYRLLDRADVLWERFAWHPRRAAEDAGLASAAGVLLGEHDFSAFRSSGHAPGSPVCRVSEAGWSRWECGLRFDVAADHFLYHMVRNLVGTMLKVATGPDPAAAMRAAIASRARAAAGATAPAHGLCLEEVEYPA